MNMDLDFILVLGVAALGFLATIVYYFSRFYFSAGKEIEEAKPDEQKPAEVDATSTDLADPAFEASGRPQPVPDQPVEAKPVKPSQPSKDKARDLRDALQNTRNSLLGRIQSIFGAPGELQEDEIESLEEVLYTSDIGPQTVQKLVEDLTENLSSEDRGSFEKVRTALKAQMTTLLEAIDDKGAQEDGPSLLSQSGPEGRPLVWMVVGVNGAGKTTTIGKLAHRMAKQGKKVLIVAGDTFRAAAQDQLAVWGQRAGVDIFRPEGVTDPSAVAFDGCKKGMEYDLVIVDTAGRLHTQDNLMEELKKMKRVVGKALDGAPDEVLIVLDANSGQNALIQAKTFNEALGVTGVVLTKLDGSAKGGVALGLAYELALPIRVIGIGEQVEDLKAFRAEEFVDSII